MSLWKATSSDLPVSLFGIRGRPHGCSQGIARLALARALYPDADILLLDDQLAAVDKSVAIHLLDTIIQGNRTVLISKSSL